MAFKTNFARSCGLAVAGALALGGASVLAKDDPGVADQVIALARAQWAAEIAGKGPADQMASVAEDYTEFNADYPTLLVGKALALKMLSVPQASTSLFSDMQNARVQVYGDTAILTYNFAGIGKGPDGKITANTAKSTRVYVRQDGKWLLVHANFAPVRGPD
jgi:ketosteroid isomerase-like protein